jgi:hypothetical protein
MRNFFTIIFLKSKMLLKDDFSAMAVVAYFLSLNIFAIMGCCKCLFQHSSLSHVPLFYSLIIMFACGLFTRFVLLNKFFNKQHFHSAMQNFTSVNKVSKIITVLYIIVSLAGMFSVV